MGCPLAIQTDLTQQPQSAGKPNSSFSYCSVLYRQLATGFLLVSKLGGFFNNEKTHELITFCFRLKFVTFFTLCSNDSGMTGQVKFIFTLT